MEITEGHSHNRELLYGDERERERQTDRQTVRERNVEERG